MKMIPTELGLSRVNVSPHGARSPWQWWLWGGLLACLTSLPLAAQTTTIYSENWDGYTSYAATSLTDTTYAFPTAAGPALVAVGNNPKGGTAGSGLQLINWLSHSGSQSLLVRSGCETDINLYQTRSGTSYQLDFWLYMHKHGPTGTMGTYNWYVRPGGEGVDNNAGDDYFAYRSDRSTTFKIFNYNGVTTAAWVDIGKTNKEDVWQHHRLSVNTASRVMTIYIDDMTTAAFTVPIARPDVAVPTLLRLQHEGTTANDGWYAIDDITLTVENAISLDAPFTDGFETYPVGNSTNINGPWITVACNGTGSNKALNPSKVQVVDSSTITPHSGTKCLEMQGGERGGVALAWGVPPKKDVKITWWANVPSATVAGLTDLKMNMALYNTIGGNTWGATTVAAELAYGLVIQSSKTVGGGNALLAGATSTTWADTTQTYTPDTWEEYQLTTYNTEGVYTVVKNPSSANPVVVVTNTTFITVGGSSGPTFMASWASPPNISGVAYIDDIRVESVTNAPYGPPAPQPSGPCTAAILSNNPTAYYSCQDQPGSLILWDSTASGSHNGRWGADTAHLYPKLGEAGIGGNSALFHPYTGSGGSPWASAGYFADLNPTGPFAVEAWVRPISVIASGARSPLASFDANNGWLIYQWPQGSGTFQWVWVQKNGGVWITSALGSANHWYHLAASFDGTYTSFYVNGQFQGRADTSAALPNTSKLLTIGAYSTSGGGAFDGNVCQVALYSHALPASEFLNHYQVGITNIQNPPIAPSITGQPSSASAYAGNAVSFQVIAQGFTPLSYQWYRNSAPVPGATSDTFQFTSDYNVDNNASYLAVVTNMYGSITSSPATLTLTTDLILSGNPVSVTRTVGSKAAFIAAAGGALPISYQWYKGSDPIPSGTNQTLWLDNVQTNADGSSYYAHLSNAFGLTADTAAATLSVVPRAITVPKSRYAALIAADDPVGYWRLDQADTNSPAVDAIGSFDGSYVATNNGAVLTFGVPTGIPLETNVAVAVTNNAGVLVPYALELNPAGPFTAEAWVKPSTLATNDQDTRCPFGSTGTGPIGWNYYQTPDNHWQVLLWGNSWLNFSIVDTNDVIVANNWYHLVLSYDGGLFKVYVNGMLRASASWAGYVRNSTGSCIFGRQSDAPANPFIGTIDDVAFYNKALTPDQIQTHYQDGVRLSITKLENNKMVLSWSMGTLQQAGTANGSYTDLTGATSPYTNSVTGDPSFFRVKAYSY
jgi:hypothetical protein